jgi:phosphoribosylglycinamide formyltransferase-1
MKKVLLMRANHLRHEALGSFLANHGYLSAEIIEKKSVRVSQSQTKIIEFHMAAREQSEFDFFSTSVVPSKEVPTIEIPTGDLNSSFVYNFLESIEFDLVITFGVSILSPKLINFLQRKILGIHLGLSPYYRGSGTNFFPFVNSEIAAVGYTLMHLDEGIDTGPIIHQGRAPVVLGDSIHTIGNRNISYMFSDIARILESRLDWNLNSQPSKPSGRLYRRNDFTIESLEIAYQNINSGLVARYIENQTSELKAFPIIEYEGIRSSK